MSATTDPLPVDTTPPTVPTGVTASATSPTSVAVSWSASFDLSGIKHYLVYMNGALKATVTGTSTTVTGLSPETTYSFSVMAVDNAPTPNTSGASATVSATTPAVPDTTAPAAPTGVTATKLGTDSIRVSWSASSDASGIKEYRVSMNGALKATVTGTTATVTGLAAGATYSFSVTAVDSAGNVSAQQRDRDRDDRPAPRRHHPADRPDGRHRVRHEPDVGRRVVERVVRPLGRQALPRLHERRLEGDRDRDLDDRDRALACRRPTPSPSWPSTTRLRPTPRLRARR